MKYLYFLSLTLTRFELKWYIFVGVVFIISLIIGALRVKKGALSVAQMLFRTFFAAYIVLILLGTIVSRTPQEPFRYNFNIIDNYKAVFTGHFSAQIETLSNIIMFIPFGLLTPFIIKKEFSKKSRVILTLSAGLLLSMLIELLQFFTGQGLFESADVLNNFLGVMIGYCIMLVIVSVIKVLKNRKRIDYVQSK